MNYENMWKELEKKLKKMVNGNHRELGLAIREMRNIYRNEQMKDPTYRKKLEEERKKLEKEEKQRELEKKQELDRIMKSRKENKKMTKKELYDVDGVKT